MAIFYRAGRTLKLKDVFTAREGVKFGRTRTGSHRALATAVAGFVHHKIEVRSVKNWHLSFPAATACKRPPALCVRQTIRSVVPRHDRCPIAAVLLRPQQALDSQPTGTADRVDMRCGWIFTVQPQFCAVGSASPSPSRISYRRSWLDFRRGGPFRYPHPPDQPKLGSFCLFLRLFVSSALAGPCSRSYPRPGRAGSR